MECNTFWTSNEETKTMKLMLFSTLLMFGGITACGAAEFADAAELASAAKFEKPVRLTAGGEAVRVESPGYAAPSWADIDGDGKKDLLVGQFRNGKIRVFKNLGDGKLAKGQWLQAEGKTAEVPGVW